MPCGPIPCTQVHAQPGPPHKYTCTFVILCVLLSGKTHSCSPEKIDNLVEQLDLKDGETLRFWYAVPLEKLEAFSGELSDSGDLKSFTVTPRGPNESTRGSCEVWILGVADPAQENYKHNASEDKCTGDLELSGIELYSDYFRTI